MSFTLGGTATGGSDYATIGASVTLGAGASSANVAVAPVDDAAVEGSETVVLTLSSGSGCTVGSPSSATVTIADDDAPIRTTGPRSPRPPAAAPATGTAAAA